MEQFKVTGMHCAACSARVEKAVLKVPGVTSCAVSLLTNSMGVEGDADAQTIISAVKQAGYGASVNGDESQGATGADTGLEDTDTPVLKKRLIASISPQEMQAAHGLTRVLFLSLLCAFLPFYLP